MAKAVGPVRVPTPRESPIHPVPRYNPKTAYMQEQLNPITRTRVVRRGPTRERVWWKTIGRGVAVVHIPADITPFWMVPII